LKRKLAIEDAKGVFGIENRLQSIPEQNEAFFANRRVQRCAQRVGKRRKKCLGSAIPDGLGRAPAHASSPIPRDRSGPSREGVDIRMLQEAIVPQQD
jgi:hypothetical protein